MARKRWPGHLARSYVASAFVTSLAKKMGHIDLRLNYPVLLSQQNYFSSSFTRHFNERRKEMTFFASLLAEKGILNACWRASR